MTTISDATWLATALLHSENVHAIDFSVQDIIQKATQEKLVDRFRPGLQVHVSKHCVANKSPNPTPYRMLFETVRGRRRLFKTGDDFHPDRAEGKVRPDRHAIPPAYRRLVDWYDEVYSKTPTELDRSPSQKIISSSGNTLTSNPRAFSSAAVDELLTVCWEKVAVDPSGTVTIPSHLRQQLGIEEGTLLNIYREGDRLILQPITEEFIHSLVGCCKGEDSLVEAREREHRLEK